MKKVAVAALLLLSGCAAPYFPVAGTPTLGDVREAKRACAYAMMNETKIADAFGLVGGLAAAPERQQIFDRCMRARGYAQLQ